MKGILPKHYASSALDPHHLGELIALVAIIDLCDRDNRAHDIVQRLHDYFRATVGSFEGKLYEPCCGSGGLFVRFADFVEPESNATHCRLAS